MIPKTRISVELVPRNEQSLLRDADLIRTSFPRVDGLNIPDLYRFSMRSWQACLLTARHFPRSVPHVRAMDIPLRGTSLVLEALEASGLPEVLVVRGDPPRDLAHNVFPTTTVEAIRRIKRELPSLKVYAGADPYRQSLVAEREYIAQKLDAGADGFFTQPFFDTRLLEIHAEMLSPSAVFWGVAPVLSSAGRAYWEATNNVHFPSFFDPSLAWNQQLARKVLSFAEATTTNIYFMPIRVDLSSYFSGIFAGGSDAEDWPTRP